MSGKAWGITAIVAIGVAVLIGAMLAESWATTSVSLPPDCPEPDETSEIDIVNCRPQFVEISPQEYHVDVQGVVRTNTPCNSVEIMFTVSGAGRRDHKVIGTWLSSMEANQSSQFDIRSSISFRPDKMQIFSLKCSSD